MLAAGFAFFGLNLGHPAHASTSGNPIVTVGNTPANPVPVTGSVTGNITGTVAVSNTPSVSVTNNPNVTVSNVPSVTLTGNPTVNLGNSPTVNIANGSTVSLDPAGNSVVQIKDILDNQPNVIIEPNLDINAAQDYSFPRTVKASCLIISTANDIFVILGVNPPNGIPYLVPIGKIFGRTNPFVINFTQPVSIQHVTVRNDDLLARATFQISAFGN